MKIKLTESQLKKIIEEELNSVILEQSVSIEEGWKEKMAGLAAGAAMMTGLGGTAKAEPVNQLQTRDGYSSTSTSPGSKSLAAPIPQQTKKLINKMKEQLINRNLSETEKQIVEDILNQVDRKIEIYKKVGKSLAEIQPELVSMLEKAGLGWLEQS